MFIFKEAGYQLFRYRWRSLIFLLASAVMCGCVAFYLGSISSNQQALDKLAETISVEVSVVDKSGVLEEDITIDEARVELLESSGYIDHILCRAIAAAAFGPGARAEDPFVGGDLMITAVNSLEAPDGVLELPPGVSEDFLSGREGLCLMDAGFMEDNSLNVGDTIRMPVYLVSWDEFGQWAYHKTGEQELEIAGTWTSENSPRDMIVPVGWLKDSAVGVKFIYSSFRGFLREPMRLNEFKAFARERGFVPLEPAFKCGFRGDSLLVEDEDFISTAQRLRRNIAAFQRLKLPFFFLVTGLVVLVIFLTLRGARRDMAIASSQGRPKLLIAAAQLMAVFPAQLAGCLAALPAMLLAGLGTGALGVCAMFITSALAGDILGLAAILRFDALAVLIKGE